MPIIKFRSALAKFRARLVVLLLTSFSTLTVHAATSDDIFRGNIVWTEYQPAHMPSRSWGKEMNFNLMHDTNAATNMPAL